MRIVICISYDAKKYRKGRTIVMLLGNDVSFEQNAIVFASLFGIEYVAVLLIQDLDFTQGKNPCSIVEKRRLFPQWCFVSDA